VTDFVSFATFCSNSTAVFRVKSSQERIFRDGPWLNQAGQFCPPEKKGLLAGSDIGWGEVQFFIIFSGPTFGDGGSNSLHPVAHARFDVLSRDGAPRGIVEFEFTQLRQLLYPVPAP
jgi:hypothetical protein